MRKFIIACDDCGDPGKTIRVKIGTKTLERDLCKRHEREEFLGWRKAARGRPATNGSMKPGRVREKV